MRKSLMMVLAAFIAMTVFISSGEAAEMSMEKPVLSVSGTGIAQAQPDRAVVSIGVRSFNKDAAIAQSDNARVSGAIQSALQSMGISASDIQTKNYDFNPSYNTDQGKRNEIIGYNVDNTVVVVVNDVNMVGKVIDTCLANGANKVNSLHFSVKNTAPLRKSALQEAIKDAREKADIIASGLGKRITGIKYVYETVGTVGQRDFSNDMVAMKASGAPETAISAGSLELNATVQIEYLLD